MKIGTEAADPRLAGNVKRFTWFRILFNARYYYPVFTILYLDYGLTLEQFAILNVVWALTIVIAEVPSGALADIFGRKPLLVFAAILMFIEMGLLACVPIGSALLFPVFLLNRVCSGLAEAAASGADEALAYDSLKALGRESEWSALLERTARSLSIAFFFTMIIGALAYDAQFIERLKNLIGIQTPLPKETIIRFPILLSWIHASLLLILVAGFHEPLKIQKSGTKGTIRQQLIAPFQQIGTAAKWTFSHRFVLFVIIAALALDSVARQFVVLASEYYRAIEIPTALFGFIGAGMALMGMVTAKLSRQMVSRNSPFANYGLLSVALIIGLAGLGLAIPHWGVLFAIPVFAMMGMVQYLSSFYINREVDSAHRATVLSFRGLALNLGLGIASLLYTAWIAFLKQGQATLSGANLTENVFVRSLAAFPFYYIALGILILILGKRFIRRKELCFTVPEPDPAQPHTASGNDR
jgi:MFS family permease